MDGVVCRCAVGVVIFCVDPLLLTGVAGNLVTKMAQRLGKAKGS